MANQNEMERNLGNRCAFSLSLVQSQLELKHNIETRATAKQIHFPDSSTNVNFHSAIPVIPLLLPILLTKLACPLARTQSVEEKRLPFT